MLESSNQPLESYPTGSLNFLNILLYTNSTKKNIKILPPANP